MQIALDPIVEDLARKGAWFAFSHSGGKDSGSAMAATAKWLDIIGHPRSRRIAVHADLGRAEWEDTLDTVRKVAAHVGVPVEIVRSTNDLVWRFEDRWRRSLERYARCETIKIVPPWSSSNSLFCRSEQKEANLSRFKSTLPGDLPVVGVIGLRRQESSGRAKAPVLSPDQRMTNRHGRQGYLWNPIIDWTTDEVFDHHRREGLPLHRAYGLGSSRLSCALCTLASRSDIEISVERGGNRDLLRTYVALEVRSAFPFQPSRWLADIVPDEQTDAIQLAEAKRIADDRQRLQAEIPATLLREKSIRNIATADAAVLGNVRSHIAKLYGISVEGADAESLMRMAQERYGG